MSARAKGASRDLSEVDQSFVCFGSLMSYFSMKVRWHFGERGFSNTASLGSLWLRCGWVYHTISHTCRPFGI